MDDGARTRTRGEGTLRRVVALLVSLALVAELGATRLAMVQLLLLWLLRRAEKIAAGFVLDATGAPPPDEIPAAAGHAPAELLRLAVRFRVLALALAALLPAGRHPRARRPAHRKPLRACPGGICAHPAFDDTS